MSKRQLAEDPFQALSGAGALRGYYSSGLLLHRPDEAGLGRLLHIELRNGPAIDDKLLEFVDGQWHEIDPLARRLVGETHGERLDAERRRKRDAILQILETEAREGRVYTLSQFAEAFDNRAGLGSSNTITERLSILATQGDIKFFKNAGAYGLRNPGSKFGFMCTRDMVLSPVEDAVDPETGELLEHGRRVLPTHFKCPQTGAALPVENPAVWVSQEPEEQ